MVPVDLRRVLSPQRGKVWHNLNLLSIVQRFITFEVGAAEATPPKVLLPPLATSMLIHSVATLMHSTKGVKEKLKY